MRTRGAFCARAQCYGGFDEAVLRRRAGKNRSGSCCCSRVILRVAGALAAGHTADGPIGALRPSKAEGLTRVAVGDGRIAGVVPVGTSQVVVNGKAPGHTTIFIWAGGTRTTYEVTVTAQQLDDVAQMIRSAHHRIPASRSSAFDHSVVVRGTVTDGAQFQQISDILARFEPLVKDGKGVIVNAVTISQNLGDLQRAIANMPGASDIRVDPDGKGNVIVSGNARDAVTAQAILDRARGFAGPYLASNGQLIDRLNSLSN